MVSGTLGSIIDLQLLEADEFGRIVKPTTGDYLLDYIQVKDDVRMAAGTIGSQGTTESEKMPGGDLEEQVLPCVPFPRDDAPAAKSLQHILQRHEHMGPRVYPPKVR